MTVCDRQNLLLTSKRPFCNKHLNFARQTKHKIQGRHIHFIINAATIVQKLEKIFYEKNATS